MCSLQRALSNHFMITGQYTHFCEYRFIHPATLGVVGVAQIESVGIIDRYAATMARIIVSETIKTDHGTSILATLPDTGQRQYED